MYLRISATGDVTVDHADGLLDVAIAQTLHAERLRAHRISSDLTLVTDASKRWGINHVATALLEAAGIGRAVTGPAVLLSCDGARILDRISIEALDALDAVSALRAEPNGHQTAPEERHA